MLRIIFFIGDRGTAYIHAEVDCVVTLETLPFVFVIPTKIQEDTLRIHLCDMEEEAPWKLHF